MGDCTAAARKIEKIAQNQDDNPAPPFFAVAHDGKHWLLSIAAVREGVDRDAMPGLLGDLVRVSSRAGARYWLHSHKRLLALSGSDSSCRAYWVSH